MVNMMVVSSGTSSDREDGGSDGRLIYFLFCVNVRDVHIKKSVAYNIDSIQTLRRTD